MGDNVLSRQKDRHPIRNKALFVGWDTGQDWKRGERQAEAEGGEKAKRERQEAKRQEAGEAGKRTVPERQASDGEVVGSKKSFCLSCGLFPSSCLFPPASCPLPPASFLLPARLNGRSVPEFNTPKMGTRFSLDRCTDGKWLDTDLHTLDRKIQAMEQHLRGMEQRTHALEETLQQYQNKHRTLESQTQAHHADLQALSQRCLLIEKQIEPRTYLEDTILILEDS